MLCLKCINYSHDWRTMSRAYNKKAQKTKCLVNIWKGSQVVDASAGANNQWQILAVTREIWNFICWNYCRITDVAVYWCNWITDRAKLIIIWLLMANLCPFVLTTQNNMLYKELNSNPSVDLMLAEKIVK